MSGFPLRAKRVPVVKPSRLVREQIYDDILELGILKRLMAFPPDLPSPAVFNADGTVTDWEALRGYDVVIATPNRASPAVEGVPVPSNNLFDLVLVDAAHHSTARSPPTPAGSTSPGRSSSARAAQDDSSWSGWRAEGRLCERRGNAASARA
jgi:hypothetical protein